MFKKLRLQLLIMNLSMFTILMVLAFSTIYIMTYNNIHKSINQELYRERDMGKFSSKKNMLPMGEDEILVKLQEGQPNLQDQVQPNNLNPELDPNISKRDSERIVTFSLLVNASGEVVEKNSFFSWDDIFCETIVNEARLTGEETGRVEVDNHQWAFLISQRDNMTKYSYVDMTSEQNVLDRLILTFLIVSLVTFLAIFLVSSFLTNRSIQPIRKAFDKQKQFISDASHELKTPLAVILANVDVLLESEKDPEDIKWLNYIKSEVKRMSKLTNDLLYLTQIENDLKAEDIQSEVVINDSLESLLLGLDAICYEKMIDLNYDIEPDMKFKGNKEQFLQVVLILLDNGMKYTPNGGKIDLKLAKTSHHLKLSVKNTGPGIKQEDIPYLFDRFYRVDKSRNRNQDSYGLGLSIAKAIINQHHGKIVCESELDKTTEFIVSLPIKN